MSLSNSGPDVLKSAIDQTLPIRTHLSAFYLSNGLPPDGGTSQSKSVLTFKFFTITLPNPKFRREIIHLHDLQHVLLNKDISWEGEAYVSGYELSTGIWKQFPIMLYSLWAMGFSLWIHPKSVLNGFYKGFQETGVIHINIPKTELLQTSFEQVQHISSKQTNKPQWSLYPVLLFWCLMSQILFLSPVLLGLFFIIL